MVVTYTNTRRDFRAFAADHYRRATSTWVTLALLVLVTLPATLGSLETNFGFLVNILAVIVIEAVLVGVAVAIFAGVILIAVAFQRNPGLLTEHTITVEPDSLTELTDVNETVTKWAGVKKARRTRQYLFIYVGPAMAHVIPRRAFASDQEWDAFGDAVSSALAAAPA